MANNQGCPGPLTTWVWGWLLKDGQKQRLRRRKIDRRGSWNSYLDEWDQPLQGCFLFVCLKVFSYANYVHTFVEHQGLFSGSMKVMQPFCETLLNKNGNMQSFPSKVWQPDFEIGTGATFVAEKERKRLAKYKNLKQNPKYGILVW